MNYAVDLLTLIECAMLGAAFSWIIEKCASRIKLAFDKRKHKNTNGNEPKF